MDRIVNFLNNGLAHNPEKLMALKKTPVISVTALVPAPKCVKKSLNISPNECSDPSAQANGKVNPIPGNLN